jgi:hypothetical protein
VSPRFTVNDAGDSPVAVSFTVYETGFEATVAVGVTVFTTDTFGVAVAFAVSSSAF